MPGYELLDAESGRGLLPWSWAVERLSRARNYWIATADADRGPHAMPVWGIWLDGAFYFSTGGRSRKARNLAADSRCVVCPERADEAVVLEGEAQEVADPSRLRRFIDVYKAKYDWEVEPSQGPIYAVRPRVVFGFIEHADDFPGSATRWTFDAN
jgi:nitroimidazol reductase NimA-like FMN-containing flavoprotein (pyridoxamine 5'-phosphate oxidase superfamily)